MPNYIVVPSLLSAFSTIQTQVSTTSWTLFMRLSIPGKMWPDAYHTLARVSSAKLSDWLIKVMFVFARKIDYNIGTGNEELGIVRDSDVPMHSWVI
jgi:hypothetical protein